VAPVAPVILHSGQQTNDVCAIYVYSGPDLNALGDIIRYNNIVDTGGLGTTASGFIAAPYLSAGVYLDDLVSNAQGLWLNRSARFAQFVVSVRLIRANRKSSQCPAR
jgi:hypothetical protein